MFIVELTADFFDSADTPKYQDIGLSVLKENQNLEFRVFKEHRQEIGSDQIGNAQGVIVLTPAVTAESVSKAGELLVIARFGVGYDAVDVKACTAADVLVTMGCGEQCPYIPGLRVVDWQLPDPKGQPMERVREIRDQIHEQVKGLLKEQCAECCAVC